MKKLNSRKLFDEFPPVKTEVWEEIILRDLKGQDYNKKLVWKPFDKLEVKPYYRAEDIESLAYLQSPPGEYPFARGGRTKDNNWKICQQVLTQDFNKANKIAREAIERGAEALILNVSDVSNPDDISSLLNNIDVCKIELHFTSASSYMKLAELLSEYLRAEKVPKENVKGSFNFDPIAYYLLNGEFYNNAEENFVEAAEIIHFTKENLPGFTVINLNGDVVHNSGGFAVQELAWSLASASEYFARLTDKGCSADDISRCCRLSLAVGQDYFLEIAKLRAARVLWALMVEEYKPGNVQSLQIKIHAENSKWNKTVYDSWVNLLRNTTESMSAAIGGADSLNSVPMDAAYRCPDAFSERIARNTQIILKEEARLGKVADPSSGSYYIENLTDSLVRLAWEEFVKIEVSGGLLKATSDGYIASEIDKACNARNIAVATRKMPVLGTTIFPNLMEKMSGKISSEKTVERKGNVKPYRGAKAFEELRLATEKFVNAGNNAPKVLLVTYGNLAMRKARAIFTANFFGVAGYDISEEYVANDTENSVEFINEQNADIVVFCSSDEEYSGFAAEIVYKLKNNSKVIKIIAGYPADSMELLKQQGVDDFIHIRSNILDTLTKFQKKFGII